VTSRCIWVIGSHPAPLIAGVINRSQISLSLSVFLSTGPPEPLRAESNLSFKAEPLSQAISSLGSLDYPG
jgi:hypothetical protein